MWKNFENVRNFGRATSHAPLTTKNNYATPQSSPHWLQLDAPHLPPKLPLPFDDLHPIYTHPSTNPIYHHKRHPDPISRFSTIHSLADRQTDTETDGIAVA